MKRRYSFIFFIIICLLSSLQATWSQKCRDYILFDGSEEVYSFGIDTTGNWWIVTKPYQNEYRLLLPGYSSETYQEIRHLTFSPDGRKFAFVGRKPTNWYFVSSDTSFSIFAEEILKIGFSGNSENIFLAFRNGIETTIYYNNQTINITNLNTSNIFINYDGNKVAFILSYGKLFSLIVPQMFESEKYDEIIPLGFWYDDGFIYAGRKGTFWQIYKNDYPLTEEFIQLIDMKINNLGTNAVFVIKRNNLDCVAVLYSEKYTEAIVSKSYEAIKNIKLHPYEPLTVFYATKGEGKYIVYGNVEYNVGDFETEPFFTFDGSEIYYCFCNIECYFYIDGKRYTLPAGNSCSNRISRKPRTNTIAFSNYTSLVMLDFFLNIQYSGMMVDNVINPIYNWKTQRYETLGEINNRIYLLTCMP